MYDFAPLLLNQSCFSDGRQKVHITTLISEGYGGREVRSQLCTLHCINVNFILFVFLRHSQRMLAFQECVVMPPCVCKETSNSIRK